MMSVRSAGSIGSFPRTAQLQFVLQSAPVREGSRTSTGASDLRRWMQTDAGGSRAADF